MNECELACTIDPFTFEEICDHWNTDADIEFVVWEECGSGDGWMWHGYSSYEDCSWDIYDYCEDWSWFGWYTDVWECSDELLYFYDNWDETLADALLTSVADIWVYYDSCFDVLTGDLDDTCGIYGTWVQDTIELHYGFDVSLMTGAVLSDELWYKIAEDMENAWLFDDSEQWMAPFFDLEWAIDNWTTSQWNQMQSAFDVSAPFATDADFQTFMQTYGYYGNSE